MRSHMLLLVATALLFASCDEDKATTPANTDPTHRDIPASLRAKCPDMTAARSVADTAVPPLTLEQNETHHVTYSVYDSTGTLVSKGETEILVWQPGNQIDIGFVGRKAWPTGHYFVFLEVRDQAGALVQSSSYCIGVRSAA